MVGLCVVAGRGLCGCAGCEVGYGECESGGGVGGFEVWVQGCLNFLMFFCVLDLF